MIISLCLSGLSSGQFGGNCIGILEQVEQDKNEMWSFAFHDGEGKKTTVNKENFFLC